MERTRDWETCKLQKRFRDFGYTFGRCYKRDTGRAYIGTLPSKKSIKLLVDGITEETDRSRTLLDADWIVGRLNRKLNGWANYSIFNQDQLQQTSNS